MSLLMRVRLTRLLVEKYPYRTIAKMTLAMAEMTVKTDINRIVRPLVGMIPSPIEIDVDSPSRKNSPNSTTL